MPTDRDVRQIELVGDLFCGHSLAASLHHVGLTARELQLEPFDQRLLLRAPAQLVDEGADARTWDDWVAAQRNLDGADESARAERLGDEAIGAGPNRGEQRLVVELGRDDEHHRARRPLGYAADREDESSRNLGVDEDEPGPVELDRFRRPRSIGDVGCYFEPGARKHATPRCANERVAAGDDDRSRLRSRLGKGRLRVPVGCRERVQVPRRRSRYLGGEVAKRCLQSMVFAMSPGNRSCG
jgi:hypothetical protein